MRRRGFTAVEVLLTIGVIGITAGVSVPMFRNYQIRSDLDLAVAQTIGGLTRAQLLSQTGQEDNMWGFRVPEGTLFQGASYAIRDPDFDEIMILPPSISVYGIEEVVFSRVDGVPSPVGDIILEALNGEQRTITVSADGMLSPSEIQPPETGDTGDSGDTGSTTGGDSGDSGNSGDTGSDTGGDSGTTTGGDTGSTTGGDSGGGSSGGGDSDDDGGSSDTPTCEDRFSVSANGTISTTGTVSMTAKALGAEITYGAGGPEVQVRAHVSTDGGSTWNMLFNGSEIDGGEEQTLTNITSDSQVVVKINGRYGWLFNKTYLSNDQSGHIEVLRNGDTPPDYDVFDTQESLSTFLADVIDDDGKISIGEYDVILLGELGSLGTSTSDFQDAVLLLTFNQATGSCASPSDPRFKITWDRLENSGQGNAKKASYVGQSAWAYGEGQWIPLFGTDGQIATDGGLVEEVEGFAIQRKNGNIRILAHGGHSGGSHKEIIDARITFEGAKITSLVNDEGTDKTENPFDNVVNDGADGDEAVLSYDSSSVLFQTRVTNADDGMFIHWVQAASSSSSAGQTSSTSSGTSGQTSSTSGNDEDDGDGDNDDGVANNDDDDDGDGDGDDGISNNSEGDTDACAAAFTVNNGIIVLQEAADVSFKALGSHVTYGNGGPEIEVRLNVSTDNGATWRSLFGFRDIDGGESDYLTDIPSGSTIILKVEGRRSWLFREQTQAGDGSGRIKIFRRKQSDPGTPIFATPTKLKSFLRSRISSRKVMVKAKEALALVELQDLGAEADFQDAAIVLTIEKPASQGICGGSSDDDEDNAEGSEVESGDTSPQAEGSEVESGDTSPQAEGAEGTNPDITICHFPPGNPRDHNSLIIPKSSWVAHGAHGDRQGACEGDEDGDGILNSLDLCPDTFMPESVPTEHMLFKRYALTEDSHIFRIGPRKKISDFTLSDTKGCSCKQLVDVAEGKKSYRFSQYPRLKRQMRSLFPFYTKGARQFGCGKAILRMIQNNAN